jgi:large conductance mechanosensitive channel
MRKKPKMADEFRNFLLKGSVLELATGVIIGLALSGVINSLVNDVIMPPVGVALGGADFQDSFIVLKPGVNGTTSFPNLAAAKAAGATTWRIGLFVNAVINFMIIGFVIFLIVKSASKAKRKEEKADPTEKDCPRCLMKVPLKATRCGHCTAEIAAEAAAAT